MFSLVLRDDGKHRMVYSTSVGFRIVFLGIALIIFLTVFTGSEGLIFKRANIVALTLCAICLLSSLFLERWVFDKESNLLENNVGLLFFYSKKRRALNTLQRVVLDELRKIGDDMKSKRKTLVSHRTIILYVQDRDGTRYKLDIVRGLGIAELRKKAERLSDFCGIPLEDNLQDSPQDSSETSEEGDL